MSDYNSNALIALRSDLKIKVKMKPLLIDMLQPPAGGFMNPAEEQSVRNAESPMEELITILLGKGNKEFSTFCDMLEKSNHSAWANRLRQEAEWYRAKNQMNGKQYGLSMYVESDGVCCGMQCFDELATRSRSTSKHHYSFY